MQSIQQDWNNFLALYNMCKSKLKPFWCDTLQLKISRVAKHTASSACALVNFLGPLYVKDTNYIIESVCYRGVTLVACI